MKPFSPQFEYFFAIELGLAQKLATENGFHGATDRILSLSHLPHAERNYEVKFPKGKAVRCFFFPKSYFSAAQMITMGLTHASKNSNDHAKFLRVTFDGPFASRTK
jgi:hypothetical protein